MKTGLYDQDFYAWANEQAGLLRAGKLSEADLEHIADEIESIGKRERRILEEHLAGLLLHLLRWQRQPSWQCYQWKLKINIQRKKLQDHLRESPSLPISEAIKYAYRHAATMAVVETGFAESIFPAVCPWSFQQIMAEDFWPEA